MPNPKASKKNTKASNMSTGSSSANSQSVIMQVVSKNTLPPFLQNKQTFPPVLRTVLRWAWKGSLTTAAGVATIQTFRLNSLYDPDFTGTGSQPRWFDLYCAASGSQAPYGYYRVKKTNFRVQVINPNSTAGTSAVAYSHARTYNGLGVSATFESYFDTPNCVPRTVSPNGSDNSIQVWEGSVDHAKFLGYHDIEDADDAIGAYNSNPSNVDYLDVGIRSYDDTTVATHSVIAQFAYDVEFFGLNVAGDS